MFRSFSPTFKYEQQVSLVKSDIETLLQRFDKSSIEKMTNLVEEGNIKKFRG